MTQNNNIFHSCKEVQYSNMFINTIINGDDIYISPCFRAYTGKSQTSKLSHDPEKSISDFNNLRYKMIDENKKISNTFDKKRMYTELCANCSSYNLCDWSYENDLISFINFSVYPAICQSKCVYCSYKTNNFTNAEFEKEGYKKIFNFLNYLKSTGKIREDVVWQISSGEITIHPYKEEIFKLVGDSAALFFSNCFIFDQQIADNLKKNKKSAINISLDSGTASTWKKVKGVDNFNTVIDNLRQYYQYCDQENHQQFQIKYIILPGINTFMKDFFNIIKILKELKVEMLYISRNLDIDYQANTSEHKKLIEYTIKLATAVKLNGLSYCLYIGAFTSDDIEYINRIVSEKINNKQITKNEESTINYE